MAIGGLTFSIEIFLLTKIVLRLGEGLKKPPFSKPKTVNRNNITALKMTINHKKGYKLSKQNFKKLYTASKQASALRNYGLACSLNILASEELIKSFVLHLKYLHPEVNFIDSDKIFFNHQHKHNELKGFLNSTHKGLELFTFNVLEDKEEFLSTLPPIKIDEYKKEYADIERVKERTEYIRRIEIDIDEIFDWLDQANNEKNLGLYVGFDKKDRKWQSPSEFSKKQFKKEKEYTKLLKLHFKNAIDITTFMKELRIRGINIDN